MIKHCIFRDMRGLMQTVVCSICGAEEAEDTWYTNAGVYPSGWHLEYVFNGRYYDGNLYCPACIPAGAQQTNLSSVAASRAWNTYHNKGNAP